MHLKLFPYVNPLNEHLNRCFKYQKNIFGRKIKLSICIFVSKKVHLVIVETRVYVVSQWFGVGDKY